MGFAMLLGDLNWLGVLVGAVLAFGFGAIWWSPKVLGNAWMAAQGKTEKDFAGSPMMPGMVTQGVALVLSGMLVATLKMLGGALFIPAVVLLILTVVVSMLAGMLFEGKSTKFWAINAGGEAISLVIIAACVLWL